MTAANSRLQDKIIANPAVEGMGTTLTALLWSDGHAAVCHIGDSRGYLLRDGELYQITHDHTLVQSLVDEGRISADDVSTHPQRSLLLRALDGRSVAEPDLSVHDAMPGDRYLLCSDGLSGVVSDETLRDTLSDIEDLEVATRELIDLAIHGGGPDNITCIVADVVDTATTRLPPPTTPILAGAAVSLGDLRPGADGTNGLTPVDHADTLDSLTAYDGLGDHHDEHLPARTAPQQAVTDDVDPRFPGDITIMASQNGSAPVGLKTAPGVPAQPPGAAPPHPGGSGSRGRRRWPIVTTSLVVLLAVIIGGGYIAWRWTQDQYYVAANSKGQVVIYRGINQKIAGVSLSSPYQQTTLQLDQVPSNYQQIVKTAYATGSLAQVQRTVGNISTAVKLCQQQYAALAAWQTKDKAYLAKVAAAQRPSRRPRASPSPAPSRPTRARRAPRPGCSASRPARSRRGRLDPGRPPRRPGEAPVSSVTAPTPAVDPDHPLVPVRQGRRGTELIMLVFAFALVAFAFANVGYSLKGRLPSSLAEYMAGFVVIVLIAHLAMRRWAPWADPLLLPLAALLNGLGVVMTYRLAAQGNLLSAPLSSSATDIQLLYTAIGIACFVAVLVLIREPRVLQRYTYTLGAIGLLLLACPRCCRPRSARSTGPRSRSGSAHSPSSRRSSPSWRWPSRSPATWWPSGTCWPWPAAGYSASTCRGPVTWAPSWWSGRPACCCWSSRATSAPARCLWACSWPCSTSPRPGPPGCCSAS